MSRDVGLAVRMLVVGGLLLGLYVVAAVGVLWFIVVAPRAWETWVFAGAVLFGLVSWVRSAGNVVLKGLRARVVERDEEPELHARVERLCALADLPKPRIAVSPLDVPNAFAGGLMPGSAVVGVTEGLRSRLEPAELEAVLAHELSHIANRDAIVVTAAGVFPAVGASMMRPTSLREVLLVPLGWLLSGVGSALMLAISRYREYTADRGAVVLTGAPEQLMSALQKLSGEMARIPTRDLRAFAGLNAFLIVPAVHPSRLELSLDHPPLDERLARLARMARELGRPLP